MRTLHLAYPPGKKNHITNLDLGAFVLNNTRYSSQGREFISTNFRMRSSELGHQGRFADGRKPYKTHQQKSEHNNAILDTYRQIQPERHLSLQHRNRLGRSLATWSCTVHWINPYCHRLHRRLRLAWAAHASASPALPLIDPNDKTWPCSFGSWPFHSRSDDAVSTAWSKGSLWPKCNLLRFPIIQKQLATQLGVLSTECLTLIFSTILMITAEDSLWRLVQ